jgi:hypothetical protein
MKSLCILCGILLLSCSNVPEVEAVAMEPNAMDSRLTAPSDQIDLKTDTLMAAVWNGAHIHYYFPTDAAKNDTVVVWLLFDPAAKGKQQIQAWKSVANERSIMWLSLDDSKNGLKVDEVIGQVKSIDSTLSNTLKKPYLLNATGLSGGSRMIAALQSINPFFKNMVLCCAAPQQAKLVCPSILYSANEDMNFLECYQYFQSSTAKDLQLRIENGKHEWPAKAVMSEMMLDLTKPLTKKMVNTSNTDLSVSTIEYELQEQEAIKKAYFQQSISYWEVYLGKKQVSKLAVEKRLLNYTSLYSYSVVNSPQVQNDPEAFDYALKIYESADPKNNEWMYLRSIYYLQRKDEINAFKYLEMAIVNRFSNTERLFQNTYWKNFMNDQRFISLLAKL